MSAVDQEVSRTVHLQVELSPGLSGHVAGHAGVPSVVSELGHVDL